MSKRKRGGLASNEDNTCNLYFIVICIELIKEIWWYIQEIFEIIIKFWENEMGKNVYKESKFFYLYHKISKPFVIKINPRI